MFKRRLISDTVCAFQTLLVPLFEQGFSFKYRVSNNNYWINIIMSFSLGLKIADKVLYTLEHVY